MRKYFHHDTLSFLHTHHTILLQNNARLHTLSVWLWPMGPLPLLTRLSPYTNPALTPIHLDRPLLSGLPVLAVTHTHRCRQPNRSLLPSQPPPPLNSPSTIRTSNRTSFLLVYSHTSETTHWGKPCWLNPYGQYKAKSRVSRPRSQSAGPRNQTLRRVINTAESPGLVKG